MEIIFGKKAPPLERLAKQAAEFGDLTKVIKDSSDEIDAIKKLLVGKANGALYPHLAKAGVKLRET